MLKFFFLVSVFKPGFKHPVCGTNGPEQIPLASSSMSKKTEGFIDALQASAALIILNTYVINMKWWHDGLVRFGSFRWACRPLKAHKKKRCTVSVTGVFVLTLCWLVGYVWNRVNWKMASNWVPVFYSLTTIQCFIWSADKGVRSHFLSKKCCLFTALLCFSTLSGKGNWKVLRMYWLLFVSYGEGWLVHWTSLKSMRILCLHVIRCDHAQNLITV